MNFVFLRSMPTFSRNLDFQSPKSQLFPEIWIFKVQNQIRLSFCTPSKLFHDTLFTESSGNRTTHPLGIGPLILWESGHHLGNGTWETGHAILWESDHLSSGKHPLGIGYLGDRFQPSRDRAVKTAPMPNAQCSLTPSTLSIRLPTNR